MTALKPPKVCHFCLRSPRGLRRMGDPVYSDVDYLTCSDCRRVLALEWADLLVRMRERAMARWRAAGADFIRPRGAAL